LLNAFVGASGFGAAFDFVARSEVNLTRLFSGTDLARGALAAVADQCLLRTSSAVLVYRAPKMVQHAADADGE
jgi:hypothetical protein